MLISTFGFAEQKIDFLFIKFFEEAQKSTSLEMFSDDSGENHDGKKGNS